MTEEMEIPMDFIGFVAIDQIDDEGYLAVAGDGSWQKLCA